MTGIRRSIADDIDDIVEPSLRAWTPVFASFSAVLGDDLCHRVRPDWQTDQAASTRRPGGDPGHAPARRTYGKAGFTACPQVLLA